MKTREELVEDVEEAKDSYDAAWDDLIAYDKES